MVEFKSRYMKENSYAQTSDNFVNTMNKILRSNNSADIISAFDQLSPNDIMGKGNVIDFNASLLILK